MDNDKFIDRLMAVSVSVGGPLEREPTYDFLEKLAVPTIAFDRIQIIQLPDSTKYYGRPTYKLRIEFRVIDRRDLSTMSDDPRFTLTFMTRCPDMWDSMRPPDQLKWLRGIMLKICEHEIDEAIFASGFGDDPHNVDGSLKQKIE